MNKYESQRGYFAYELYQIMKEDKNIILLFGDLGYKQFDHHRKDFPDQCINTGASEQTMLDMAVGIAYSGKIPIVYSITPFALYRPFETIRTYINHENLPVKIIGGGRDKDYSHDGISHWCEDDRSIMTSLKPMNFKIYHPEHKDDMTIEYLKDKIYSPYPVYLNVKR